MKKIPYAIVTAVYDENEVSKLLKTLDSFNLIGLTNYKWYLGLRYDFVDELPEQIKCNQNVVWKITNDRSIYNSWNMMLPNIDADWLLFLGCGDTIHPSFNETKWVEVLDRHLTKDMVFGDTDIVTDNYELLYTKKNNNVSIPYNYRLGRPDTPVHPEVFHRNFKAEDLRVKFNEEYEIAADYHWMLGKLIQNKFLYIPEKVSQQIAGGKSQDPKNIHQVESEIKEIIKFYKIQIPLIFRIINKIKNHFKCLMFKLVGYEKYDWLKHALQKRIYK